jgi:glucose-6-phosphate isomerase
MNIQYSLPKHLQTGLQAALADWAGKNKLAKLWAKDASLWTNNDESKWLGWLDIVERQQKQLADYTALAAEVKQAGFTHALLLGMGGSSLCPEVLAITFGHQPGAPALHILDSTDPAQVAAAERAVNLKTTVVIVASKSGSTLEPNILKQYFFDQMEKAVGKGNAGSHFIAITDPGSKLEQVAKADGFRKIFYGDATIGGRFSALSNFGLVPAALMGLDVERWLAAAQRSVEAAKNADLENNAAAVLGLILGLAHNAGQNKITYFTSPEIYDLGAWLEQLIAESTGKLGKGITPVDREHIAAPSVYGTDRIFAYVKLKGSDSAHLDAKVKALEDAGQPVVRFEIADRYELSAEFFTWEIATAIAGSIMEINPFNQPDVEAAKIATRALTSEYEKTGKLAELTPLLEQDGMKLFADERYTAVLTAAAKEKTLAGIMRAHLNQIGVGDYFATLAFINMTPGHEAIIQEFRHKVRGAKKVATCLGFGPRFLHSTGQDYKGGPNTGVFLQITADHAKDVAIPDAKYTFGVVITAQAAGDLTVLQERNRRALHVHLGKDVDAGLKALDKLVVGAL